MSKFYYCGRWWRLTDMSGIDLSRDGWWFVGSFSEGDLYMNNIEGEMLLSSGTLNYICSI